MENLSPGPNYFCKMKHWISLYYLAYLYMRWRYGQVYVDDAP
uniref:Uncharacterized protein n=1 Tax=Arundo donax TaxID=35708 RepID=A0A0A9FU24_ARUDO